MKDLVKYIAQAIADYPEEVQVTEIHGGRTSVIELKLAKEDVGKLIGAKGSRVKAIGTIVNAAGRKLKRRAVIEIKK